MCLSVGGCLIDLERIATTATARRFIRCLRTTFEPATLQESWRYKNESRPKYLSNVEQGSLL